MQLNHPRAVTLSILCVLGANRIPAATQAAEKDAARAHRIVLKADLRMTVDGIRSKVTSDVAIDYALQQKDREIVVSMTSIDVRLLVDGREQMTSLMSRNRFKFNSKGQRLDVTYKEAPPPLQELLKDSFEAPLCKVQVDESGRELKRTIVAGKGAKSTIDAGQIDNLLLFQVAFPARETKWQQVRRVSMGDQSHAEGKLDYEKLSVKDGRARVRVSGVLSNKSVMRKGAPGKVTNVRYVVTGEQSYDTEQRRWISGELKIDASFDIEKDEKKIGSGKGAMTVRHESPPKNDATTDDKPKE